MAEQTHVLFVEDDDVIREATQLALERDGFAVTAMPDGLSGLEAFRANRPDIALLDVMVPGLDGVSLCRRIRDESTVPVIMRYDETPGGGTLTRLTGDGTARTILSE
ncbi:response regulator, partial [Streptomyces sp. NPDC002586]